MNPTGSKHAPRVGLSPAKRTLLGRDPVLYARKRGHKVECQFTWGVVNLFEDKAPEKFAFDIAMEFRDCVVVYGTKEQL